MSSKEYNNMLLFNKSIGYFMDSFQEKLPVFPYVYCASIFVKPADRNLS